MAIQRIVETQTRGTPIQYREGGLRQAGTLDEDRASQQFLQSTIDALSAHIAILDEAGNIIAVNDPWRRFGADNGLQSPGHGLGANYLAVCESAQECEESAAVAEGIRAILEGSKTEFRIVYRCHSAEEKRWFQLRATRFYDNGSIRLVMAHENITEIKHAEEELRCMTDQLLRLQDDERARIARDLHDVTAQNIFAMTMNLARLRRLLPDLAGRAEELVAETILLGEESLQEIRTVSYVLHPPTVRGEGLVSALRAYIEGFVKRTGIQVTLDAEPQRMHLAADVQTALFRIVQESLANIIRHSRSRTARIELSKSECQVLLRVKDEGIGIPSEILDAPAGQVRSIGVGIPGMRTRLRQLGGKLTIESGRRGTTVVATVPIQKVSL
jgi:signal transduction histidine kinase